MKFKKYHKPGTAPGTLIPPIQAPPEVQIKLIAYSTDFFEEKKLHDLDEIAAYRDSPHIIWISVEGLGQVEVLEQLGQQFGLHPLALEDVLNIGQRPKLDDYESHLFFILRVAHLKEEIETEQFSFFLGERFLISIEETPGNGFEMIRERLRRGRTQIRRSGADYLAYTLIDAAIDSYFPVMEFLGERVEDLEIEVVEAPSKATLIEVHKLKRELLHLRRVLWPSRDTINMLMREDEGLITQQTRFFLRDCYDHAVQIIDILETHRDLSTGIMDVYLSSLSNRLSEIMKVLTIISTIFIPLTFISGIYGMNFDADASPWNMPELRAYFGYPAILLFMLIVALVMLGYFRRRGWI
ncbi:MAG: magnesium/cobalt transporter CorA [Acidobacteria bacterium]|nr:magnesium/cobalt transporter CorA [Acidobacteriota bacterium]